MQTLETLDYETLLREGIAEAGGQEEDLNLLTADDFKNLGKTAAERGVKKRMKFPSWLVEPVTDIEDAKKRGHFTSCYDHITAKTVKLPKAQGKKRVFAVPFNKSIGEKAYVALLAEHGLKPCVNAPSYLMGLMVQVPESEMPAELKGKYIVAAEPDVASSVFRGLDGVRCFLCVDRLGGASRELDLTRVGFGGWDGAWAFLAEEA